MTLGEKLIIACCRSSDYDTFGRIKKVKLLDEDEIKLFKKVQDYYKVTSVLPTLTVLETDFRCKDVDTVDAATSYYLQEVHNRFIYTSLGEGVPKIIASLKSDPAKGLSSLATIVGNLSGDEFSRDVPYAEAATKRYTEYEKKKGTKGVTYMSTGHDTLDKVTFGYHRGDLWTLGGRAGTKKTFSLLHLAESCLPCIPEDAGDALFISNEMPPEKIIERLDALRFKLNYSRFNSGDLNEIEEKRYKKGLMMLERSKNRLHILYNIISLEDVRTKVSLYRPSILFLDGSYLLDAGKEDSVAKNMLLTRGMKQLAKDFQIPFINTTQLRKKTGKGMIKDFLTGQDEFYYGGYVQDSDIAIRTYLNPTMVYEQSVGWDFVKHRENAHCSLELMAPLTTMEFGFREPKAVTVEEEELTY